MLVPRVIAGNQLIMVLNRAIHRVLINSHICTHVSLITIQTVKEHVLHMDQCSQRTIRRIVYLFCRSLGCRGSFALKALVIS